MTSQPTPPGPSGSPPQRPGIRFDEYITANNVIVAAVDRFDDYTATVALPPDWEPITSAPATRAWVWRADPFRTRFCASVVLTHTLLEATPDPAETFTMLCAWNANLFPATYEYIREVEAANDGPGLLGRFAMLMNADVGVVTIESLTRIITTQQHTLIAQLTLTALAESPIDRPQIRLTMTPAQSRWAAPDPDHAAAAPRTEGSGR